MLIVVFSRWWYMCFSFKILFCIFQILHRNCIMKKQVLHDAVFTPVKNTLGEHIFLMYTKRFLNKYKYTSILRYMIMKKYFSGRGLNDYSILLKFLNFQK